MKIHYPEELPISSHREELVNAIRENDVTIIVGETGSGKSTQIPKIIAEALGERAIIACTQPRRIAAVSIASRIAEECEVDLGSSVGYRIRFDDYTYSGTKITICTDGILLQEIKFDILLSHYDVVFVDEAHERSLRIDFLLGLLKDIQVKRKHKNMSPLKIIIASATLDTEAFVSFFHDSRELLRIADFSIAGRVFPVEVEYRPIAFEENLSLKIAEIVHEIHKSSKPGDILVFLPGVQEIVATIKAIQVFGYPNLHCLPLFSRLSMEEQTAIFAPHPGKRHVVVATNIAETTLTVPGIVTVIDSGLARMTDFDTQTGIGSLTVQKISQASAIQRAGRAGRIEPGRCFRLYSQEDFRRREAFTRPEIQRSDLAEVVLQMILMGIPNIHTFEFMDPPNRESFEQAIGTLRTLGALDKHEKLTDIGYKMAHLPLDPRISRMLLTAKDYDCVPEVAVIASFLSLKDPFLRPLGEEDVADRFRSYFQRLGMSRAVIQSKPYFNGRRMVYRKKYSYHGKSQAYNSDLLTYLALWKKIFSLPEQEREQYCVSHYIEFESLERAKEIYQQLTDTLIQFYGEAFEPYHHKLQSMLEPESPEKGLNINPFAIIKSIATGFVQNLCQRNAFGNYTSLKADRIFIHPSSLFFNRHPHFIVATEIIQTTKLFARNVTEIDASWIPKNLLYKRSKKSKKRSSKTFKKDRFRYNKRRRR